MDPTKITTLTTATTGLKNVIDIGTSIVSVFRTTGIIRQADVARLKQSIALAKEQEHMRHVYDLTSEGIKLADDLMRKFEQYSFSPEFRSQAVEILSSGIKGISRCIHHFEDSPY